MSGWKGWFRPNGGISAPARNTPGDLGPFPGSAAEQFLGEPIGRDTLNAVGLGAAVIGQHDPEAMIAVFTADHIIRPVDRFQAIIA